MMHIVVTDWSGSTVHVESVKEIDFGEMKQYKLAFKSSLDQLRDEYPSGSYRISVFGSDSDAPVSLDIITSSGLSASDLK